MMIEYLQEVSPRGEHKPAGDKTPVESISPKPKKHVTGRNFTNLSRFSEYRHKLTSCFLKIINSLKKYFLCPLENSWNAIIITTLFVKKLQNRILLK